MQMLSELQAAPCGSDVMQLLQQSLTATDFYGSLCVKGCISDLVAVVTQNK